MQRRLAGQDSQETGVSQRCDIIRAIR
jgi:hypothetical protein